MPDVSFTFNAEQFTTTAYVAAKEITDQLDYQLPLLARSEEVHGKGTPKEEGGTRVFIGLNFSEHSETTELTSGYEPINLDITEVGTPGVDDWADSIRPVVISGHEQRINRGSQHKVLDIVSERTKAMMAAYRRQFHKRSWGLASSGLTDVNTLNGDDFSDGFLESIPPPGQTNSVHGVSKATYNFSVGWQNQAVDVANSFSANGLLALDELMVEIGTLKTVPTAKGCWYASRPGFRNLKRAVRSNERYIDQSTLDTGRLTLQYNGYMVEVNRDMPQGATSGLNDGEWSFVFLDHEMIYWLTNGPDYFRMGTFEVQSGYDVTAANCHLMGQWIAKYLGSSGVIINADGW